MGSKLTDRLKRLHSSRVRATAETDGVTGAHEDRVHSEQPVEAPENPAIRAQLERHQRLAAKSSSQKAAPREDRIGRTEPTASSGHDPTIGEHLGILRTHARALIEAGLGPTALPLLHEMVSISPTNPYALAELARHYRAAGRTDLAELYEGRLKAAAPY